MTTKIRKIHDDLEEPSGAPTSGLAEQGIWNGGMPAASQALGASRVQQAVSRTLRLLRKIRLLRDELRKAEAERDVYREQLQRMIGMSLDDWELSRSDAESLQIRHRAYKLMVQHYARTGAAIDPSLFAQQRSAVMQHLVLQRRKGVAIEDISVEGIAFLLQMGQHRTVGFARAEDAGCEAPRNLR